MDTILIVLLITTLIILALAYYVYTTESFRIHSNIGKFQYMRPRFWAGSTISKNVDPVDININIAYDNSAEHGAPDVGVSSNADMETEHEHMIRSPLRYKH